MCLGFCNLLIIILFYFITFPSKTQTELDIAIL